MPAERVMPDMFAPDVIAENKLRCPVARVPALLGLRAMHKPTYASLIAMAIHSSPDKRLMLNEIYDFVNAHRTLVPTASQPNWKNSIRHNLSLRPCFKKVPRWSSDGKKLSAYWVLDQTCLPSAAQSMVQQLDSVGNIRFPEEFLCTDPALNPGDVALQPPHGNRGRSSGLLTPDNSDDSGDYGSTGSQSAKRRKTSSNPAKRLESGAGVLDQAVLASLMQSQYFAAQPQFPNPAMFQPGAAGMSVPAITAMHYLQQIQQMAGLSPMQMFPCMLELIKQQAVAAVAASHINAAAAAGVAGPPIISPPATPVSGSPPTMGGAAPDAIAVAPTTVLAGAGDEVPPSPRTGMALLLAAAGVD